MLEHLGQLAGLEIGCAKRRKAWIEEAYVKLTTNILEELLTGIGQLTVPAKERRKVLTYINNNQYYQSKRKQ